MTFASRLTRVWMIAAATLTLLVGCGDGGEQPLRAAPSASPSEETDTRFSDVDVRFVTHMIEHHRQALDMAGIADERDASPAVRELAAKIAEAQEPEILLMESYLAKWVGPAASPDPDAVHEHDEGTESMPGMISFDRMEDLNLARGRAFDRLFLKLMIEHHQGAVVMANEQLASGRNNGANGLAHLIIQDQTAEIATMERLLKTA